MELNSIKKDAVAYDELVVTDSAGDLVTGLTNNDFTRDLYNPDGDEVSSTITITVAELGTGKYRVNFTPNELGNWVITIYHATYFSAGKSANYTCVTNLNDDIPGAVWDVNLNEHVSSSRSTGYRIKHISAASTTRIFNRGIWTKAEKEALFKQVTGLCDDLIIVKDKDEVVKMVKSVKGISSTITDIKGLVTGLRELDNFKEFKDSMESSAQGNEEINLKLTGQIDELKTTFVSLSENVGLISEQQNWLKSLSTKKDVEKLVNNVKSADKNINKTELLLSEIYNYLEELTGLFIKTISTDKLEAVVKGGVNE